MNTSTDNNNERERARQIIEFTGTHLFLTGKAGTGKTTFLRELQKDSPKRMIVLAPTGIAAINAGGSTIHSFFQLPFAPFIPEDHYKKMDFKLRKQKIKLIRSLDLVVIDEISMVRADLLDQIDAVLRQYRNRYEPFGGVQLLMIGDLQQLAPVAKEEEWNLLSKYYESPYFFSSHALKQTNYVTIELQKVYRQSDPKFLNLLNCIRSNKTTPEILYQLNQRFIPNFQPKENERYIRLVTHNWQAQQINEGELAKIKETTYTFDAKVEGTFPEYSYPTDSRLSLKLGAQIMFVKNDTDKRYYNGTLGEVVKIDEQSCTVRTADRGFEIALEPEEWQNTRYALNDKTQQIEEKVEGSFHQLPVKLAWAITIHKSQGLTFEHAIIDAHSAFAHGQTYVALSRCKTLEGLVLSSPIPASAIIQDQAVRQFNENVEQQQPTASAIEMLRQQHCLNLISGLFDFSGVRHCLEATVRILEGNFYQLYPETVKKYKEQQSTFNDTVILVAEKFRTQYQRLVSSNTEEGISSELQERLRKGADYFHQHLSPLDNLVASTRLPSDNKDIQKRVNSILEEARQVVSEKCQLLAYVAASGFEIIEFQKCRALLAAGQAITVTGAPDLTKQQEIENSKSKKQEKLDVPSEIKHPDLYKELQLWRNQKAHQEMLPPYMILQNKAMLGIANLLPMDLRTLGMIPYFGTKGLEKYGEEILEIVQSYVKKKQIKVKEPTLFLKTNEPSHQKVHQPRKKEESYITSFKLYKELKNIDKVAQERYLAQSTVSGHLAKAVQEGLLPLEEFVPAEKIENIKKCIAQLSQTEPPKMADIRAALGESYQFSEISAVLSQLKK